jgi:hypothetical protein
VAERRRVLVEFRDPAKGRRYMDHEIEISDDGRVQPILRDNRGWRFSHTSALRNERGHPFDKTTVYVFTAR